MKKHDPMDDILDRPIAYNPALKRITGSTNAAILLSQIWYWSKRTADPEGWFWKSSKEWKDETALTDNEIVGARKVLRELGVVDEVLKGVPATINYRILKPRIYELLGVQFPVKSESEIPTPSESGLPGNSQIPTKQESDGIGNFNNEPENTPEITPVKGDILDGMIHYAQVAKERGEDKVEAIIAELEAGLRVNIVRSLANQGVAKRILKDGRPVKHWLAWVAADEWRLAHCYLYADLERVWRDWPQAFPKKGSEKQQGSSFYG